MKKIPFFIIFISCLFLWTPVRGQSSPIPVEEGKEIYAVVKDVQGDTVEGYLRLPSEGIVVRSQYNQEKTVPVKQLKSITLEKQKDGLTEKDIAYRVQVKNSREIFTLGEKYTFSLNTHLGLVTRTIDPDRVNSSRTKETPSEAKVDFGKPFIQDKSVVFSLEFKF
ncbi:MAG: hypothetical protein NTY64_24150 [Deltaproteobacteria bacterium]|nr:hypothetical protein [Deltaproteobacteria bacterium]